jgi:uncharacterized protein YlxP (DUF503 family)
MVIGVCKVTLLLHGNRSLKGKRRVLKSIMGKVKNRFNLTIAEVGCNDVWQRAEIGFAAIGNDKAFINSVIDTALSFIEDLQLGEVTDHRIELINL